MNTKTFLIHETNRTEAEGNIAKLNKKFEKHEIPTIKATWSDKDGFDVYELTVEYEDVPTISGIDYKYLGYIMYEDGSKFFNGFEENSERFNMIKSMNCTCEMCKKQITNRNSFFVFENSENEIKMFGSSCAKKAFPFNIEMYLNGLENEFENLEDLTVGVLPFDEDVRSIGGKKYFNIDVMLNALNVATHDFTCWVSKDKADMEMVMSTKEKVIDIITDK